MRFLLLLALASLLLLTQSTDNNANTEPPEISTNKYDNFTPEELEPKMKQAEADAKSAKDKYDDARKILENNEAEAERLNATYNKKKEEWEELEAAEHAAVDAQENYTTNSDQLKKAQKDLDEINERPEKFAAAQLELTNWKQWEPSTENEKKFRDAASNTKKGQKAQNDTLIAHIQLLPQPCTSEPVSVECTEVKGLEEKLAKAVEEAEKAEANWQSYETNSHVDVYGMKHASLVYQRQLRKEKMDTMDADKKPIEEKKKQLEALDPELSEIVTKSTATRDRLKEAFPDALVEKIKAEKAKKIADDEVTKQKDEVDKLEKISNNANKYEQTMKMVYEKKKKDNEKGVDKAGFPVWIVVLVIMLLLVVVGIILFVCWKRRQKKRNEAPPATPESGSQTPACDTKITVNTVIPATPATPATTATKTKSEQETKSNAETKKVTEFKLSDPLPDIPKISIDKINKSGHVKEGVTTATRHEVTTDDGRTYKDTRFLCKCNLICRVNDNGEMRCVVAPEDVINKGLLEIRERGPEQFQVHKLKDMKPRDKLKEIEYNKDEFAVYIVEKDPPKAEMKKLLKDSEKRAAASGARVPVGMDVDGFSRDSIPALLSDMCRPEYAGKNRYPIHPDVYMKLLDYVDEEFNKEKQVVDISYPITIVGDLHGEFKSLLNISEVMADGDTPGFLATNWVFMGDYVDRGVQSIEVLATLFSLKIRFPRNIAMLRGNHETVAINKKGGFWDEIKDRYSKADANRVYKRSNEVFNNMPHIGMISKSIMCLHGGITPDLKDRDSMDAVKKPTDPTKNRLSADVLWSDIVKCLKWFVPNFLRGEGKAFGEDQVNECLKTMDILRICRGHKQQPNGSSNALDHRCCTVFSSQGGPMEGLPHDNYIAVEHVNEKGQICPKFIYLVKRSNGGSIDVNSAYAEFVSRTNASHDRDRNYHTMKDLEGRKIIIKAVQQARIENREKDKKGNAETPELPPYDDLTQRARSSEDTGTSSVHGQ